MTCEATQAGEFLAHLTPQPKYLIFIDAACLSFFAYLTHEDFVSRPNSFHAVRPLSCQPGTVRGTR